MRKFIFAAALSAILFAGCQNQGKGSGSQTVTEVRRVEHAAGQVVYIHIDSLLMNYELAKELQNDFRIKFEKAEKELETKRTRFERDYMDFAEKAQKGLATRSQLAEMEQKLQQQEFQLRQDAEILASELAEEEQVLNNRIYFAVTDFLKEYNSDYKYSMIISTSTSGPILNADPSLSITQEVLKALNDRHAKEKAGRK